jgi:ribosomal protein S18 acetylase RimI-like enzyme
VGEDQFMTEGGRSGAVGEDQLITEGGGADLLIRPAARDDFEALVDLDLASAIHHAALDPDFYRVPERAAVASFLEERLADTDREVLVAVVGGKVVGSVDVTMQDPPHEGSIVRPIPTADLGIGVAEAWRRRGIGRALMAAAEASALARGAQQMVLDMATANVEARRFYDALGYVEHGLFLRRLLP